MENKKYYEIIYDDIVDDVIFKFKKLNPIEHLSFILKSQDDQGQIDKVEEFVKKVLQCCLWSKDMKNFFPLVDDSGSARLPELNDDPGISLIMFSRFKSEVLMPVFTESKAFQKGLKEKETKQAEQ
jgi:hypothetical protein